MLNLKLLGTAAGGGLPQWNCSCAVCELCRTHPDRISPRLQLQAVVQDGPSRLFLLNASPDLKFQIEATPELWPRRTAGKRNTPIQGIILTSAELDQVLGLLLLREFQPLTVYATALVRQVLESNSFFRMLERVPNQLTWVDIVPEKSFSFGKSAITCTPIALADGLPFYAREMGAKHTGEASIGLLLESDGQRVAYTPAVPEITPKLRAIYATCDAILIDGTFWGDAELSETQTGTPLARSIGHVPMSGVDGTIALLSDLPIARKVFIHINNTNPVLDPRGDEHKAVVAAGWQIAHDGWQLNGVAR